MKRDSINYTIVGVAVLAALVLLLASLAAITGKGGAATSYYVVYRNVTGLKPGAPVFYEGFRVGQVGKIEPQRGAEKTRYRVELEVRRDWPIPTDSIARLASSGLLADVSIAVREGIAKDALKPGAELKGEEGADVFAALNELAGEVTILTRERISPLVDTLSRRVDSITTNLDTSTPLLHGEAETLLKRLNTAANSVNDVLSKGNREQIDASLSNIREVTAELKGTQAKLDKLLEEVRGTVAEDRPALRAAITDLAHITSSLSRRIDTIAHNLESSSRNFNEFTREVRKSPNRLLITPKADKVKEEEQ
jgi:phospholipid/cholesterol/gamma-HCH transport system substrate-binding protein